MNTRPEGDTLGLEDFPEPVYLPRPFDGRVFGTPLSLSILEGPPVDLWTSLPPIEPDAQGELALLLQLDESVVFGRQEGGEVEYLDPRYRPTRMAPHSDQMVVALDHNRFAMSVSRGHFMLTGSPLGIVLLNGVPQRGGGVRPPMNGTMMEAPERRRMCDGEEYLIAHGAAVKIRLPNGTLISLQAE